MAMDRQTCAEEDQLHLRVHQLVLAQEIEQERSLLFQIVNHLQQEIVNHPRHQRDRQVERLRHQDHRLAHSAVVEVVALWAEAVPEWVVVVEEDVSHFSHYLSDALISRTATYLPFLFSK